MNPEQMKAWIDSANYESLLSKWRFAPAGDPYFQGEMGDYYADAMAKKKSEVGDAEHVRTSKRIGWDRHDILISIFAAMSVLGPIMAAFL